jgi:hypothetical protein
MATQFNLNQHAFTIGVMLTFEVEAGLGDAPLSIPRSTVAEQIYSVAIKVFRLSLQ